MPIVKYEEEVKVILARSNGLANLCCQCAGDWCPKQCKHLNAISNNGAAVQFIIRMLMTGT